MRLLAVSVDLDGEEEYRAIHGLPRAVAPGSSLVFGRALPRLTAWAAELGVPMTLFVIARDMAKEGAPRALRDAVALGHELGNHTLDHPYDLTRLPRAEQRRQIEAATEILSRATGSVPLGFRAPGYATSPSLLEIVREAGLRYDASAFPCPAYALAKNSVLVARRAVGKTSAAVPTRLGDTLGKREPHVVDGLLEIPMAVTRRTRLPVFGTSLATAPSLLRGQLLRGVVGDRVVSLELHALDALSAGDGLGALARAQPDLRLGWQKKLARLGDAIRTLQAAGYEGKRLSEITA